MDGWCCKMLMLTYIDVDDIDVDDIEDADDKDSMEWMEGVARYRKILHVCKLAAGAEEEKGRAAKGKYDLAVRSVMIGRKGKQDRLGRFLRLAMGKRQEQRCKDMAP